MKPATIIGGAALCLAAIQLIPSAKNHTNPPITGEPRMERPRNTGAFFSEHAATAIPMKTIWPMVQPHSAAFLALAA